MKLNILIVLAVGLLTYGATFYFDRAENTLPPADIAAPTQSVASVETNEVEISQNVPDFSFTTLDGSPFDIRDFKGKNIILNFWATWCAPCVKEFPDLVKIATDYKENTVLIALSSDLEKESVQKFLTKIEKGGALNTGAENIFIALDENQNITQKLFQTFRLPETIIIDKNQKMRLKIVGAEWTPEDITSMLQEL